MEGSTMTENNVQNPGVSRPSVSDEVIDELMARVDADGAELLGPDGLLNQMTKAGLERALDEELADHLGYEKGDPTGRGSGNSATAPHQEASRNRPGNGGGSRVPGVPRG